jgi:hypothetical protein
MEFERDSFSLTGSVPYLIPGILIIALFQWFGAGFIGIVAVASDRSVGSALVFILMAFAAGHILNLLRKSVYSKDTAHSEEQLALQMVRENDSHFSPEVKKDLARFSETVLGVPSTSPEFFRLCCSFVMQKNVAMRAERTAARRELLSLFSITGDLGVLAGALIALKHLFFKMLPMFDIELPVTPFTDYDQTQMMIGLVAAIVLFLIRRPLKKLIISAKEQTADAVIRAFYLSCKLDENASHA